MIYYCCTATNFLLTCTIISLLYVYCYQIFQKISHLYICSDLYFYYSLFGTGLIFGSLEQVFSSHILICFLLLYPKENSTTIVALNCKWSCCGSNIRICWLNGFFHFSRHSIMWRRVTSDDDFDIGSTFLSRAFRIICHVDIIGTEMTRRNLQIG